MAVQNNDVFVTFPRQLQSCRQAENASADNNEPPGWLHG